MEADIDRLATRLHDAFDRVASNDTPALWAPLLRLLARGEPVTAEDLAASTGRSAEDLRRVLPALPSIELDDHGRVVGSGITLRPTPHRFIVGHRQLYTWCAIDTLIFPHVLGEPAQVLSPCHQTGEPVSLTVLPDRIEDLEPDTAVVSVVIPDDVTNVRAAFCDQVHFFTSRQAARPWLRQHPGMRVLEIEDAFELAHKMSTGVLDGPDVGAAPPIHHHGE